jgi:hypothetical protein
VPGHALSRFRCGLDDLFAMPFRHRTPAARRLLKSNVVAARLFQNLLARIPRMTD